MHPALNSVPRAEFVLLFPVPVNGEFPKSCKSPGAEGALLARCDAALRSESQPMWSRWHSHTQPRFAREPQKVPITANTPLCPPVLLFTSPSNAATNKVGWVQQVPQETARTSPRGPGPVI